ncbi:MAG: prolipoprotein diacylglyceryl transferase [Oscillospiraceae bacterium]|nr:prolipoprotein diacylglyceryl transferase [Oscillospiraceae bacterium]
MNSVAMYLGERTIQWSAILIAVGALCCLFLTIALYRPRSESLRAVLVLFPLGTILGLFLARLIHWYFNTEIYGSFGAAFSNFDLGSFSIPGVILGVWLAAWIVYRLGLVPNTGMLLDCAAPGMALLIAFVRLGALFTNTCRSRILVEAKVLKMLPFSVAHTDAAGNVIWRLAVFFQAFLAMLLLTVILLHFYVKRGKRKMIAPCPRSGNVWRMFLLCYGAIEIVVDSLRNDSPLMHFHLISDLNQYSSFVSLAQIFAAATALYVLIFYSVKSIKAKGFSFWHALSWVGFVASLVGIGYFGEYKVQRTAQYLKCYTIQILSCLAMVIIIRLVYDSCVAKKKPKYEW